MSVTSLNPGPLFRDTGLNSRHTPGDLSENQSDLQAKRSREAASPKPPDGPVAEVYDVHNTSTKLVLLNNTLRPKSSSHLRGYSNKPSTASPNPGRHTPEKSPHKNEERHMRCKGSSSPLPVAAPMKKEKERKEKSKSDKPKKEESETSGPHLPAPPRCGIPSHRRKPPISMSDNHFLTDSSLTFGNRLYLWQIARVYDVQDMHNKKLAQYRELLMRQQGLGWHSKDDYAKYMYQIHRPKQNLYGASASPRPKSQQSKRTSTSESKDSSSSRSMSSSKSGKTSSTSKRERTQSPGKDVASEKDKGASNHKKKKKKEDDRKVLHKDEQETKDTSDNGSSNKTARTKPKNNLDLLKVVADEYSAEERCANDSSSEQSESRGEYLDLLKVVADEYSAEEGCANDSSSEQSESRGEYPASYGKRDSHKDSHHAKKTRSERNRSQSPESSKEQYKVTMSSSSSNDSLSPREKEDASTSKDEADHFEIGVDSPLMKSQHNSSDSPTDSIQSSPSPRGKDHVSKNKVDYSEIRVDSPLMKDHHDSSDSSRDSIQSSPSPREKDHDSKNKVDHSEIRVDYPLIKTRHNSSDSPRDSIQSSPREKDDDSKNKVDHSEIRVNSPLIKSKHDSSDSPRDSTQSSPRKKDDDSKNKVEYSEIRVDSPLMKDHHDSSDSSRDHHDSSDSSGDSIQSSPSPWEKDHDSKNKVDRSEIRVDSPLIKSQHNSSDSPRDSIQSSPREKNDDSKNKVDHSEIRVNSPLIKSKHDSSDSPRDSIQPSPRKKDDDSKNKVEYSEMRVDSPLMKDHHDSSDSSRDHHDSSDSSRDSIQSSPSPREKDHDSKNKVDRSEIRVDSPLIKSQHNSSDSPRDSIQSSPREKNDDSKNKVDHSEIRVNSRLIKSKHDSSDSPRDSIQSSSSPREKDHASKNKVEYSEIRVDSPLMKDHHDSSDSSRDSIESSPSPREKDYDSKNKVDHSKIRADSPLMKGHHDSSDSPRDSIQSSPSPREKYHASKNKVDQSEIRVDTPLIKSQYDSDSPRGSIQSLPKTTEQDQEREGKANNDDDYQRVDQLSTSNEDVAVTSVKERDFELPSPQFAYGPNSNEPDKNGNMQNSDDETDQDDSEDGSNSQRWSPIVLHGPEGTSRPKSRLGNRPKPEENKAPHSETENSSEEDTVKIKANGEDVANGNIDNKSLSDSEHVYPSDPKSVKDTDSNSGSDVAKEGQELNQNGPKSDHSSKDYSQGVSSTYGTKGSNDTDGPSSFAQHPKEENQSAVQVNKPTTEEDVDNGNSDNNSIPDPEHVSPSVPNMVHDTESKSGSDIEAAAQELNQNVPNSDRSSVVYSQGVSSTYGRKSSSDTDGPVSVEQHSQEENESTKQVTKPNTEDYEVSDNELNKADISRNPIEKSDNITSGEEGDTEDSSEEEVIDDADLLIAQPREIRTSNLDRSDVIDTTHTGSDNSDDQSRRKPATSESEPPIIGKTDISQDDDHSVASKTDDVSDRNSEGDVDKESTTAEVKLQEQKTAERQRINEENFGRMRFKSKSTTFVKADDNNMKENGVADDSEDILSDSSIDSSSHK